MKICCCHSADSCLSCKKSFRNTEKRKYCLNVSASFQTKYCDKNKHAIANTMCAASKGT